MLRQVLVYKTRIFHAETNSASATCDSNDEINRSRSSSPPLIRSGQASPLLQIDDTLSFLGAWTESLPQWRPSEKVDQLSPPLLQDIAHYSQCRRATSRSAESHHLENVRSFESIERSRLFEYRGSTAYKQLGKLRQSAPQDAPSRSSRSRTCPHFSESRSCRIDQRNVHFQEHYASKNSVNNQGARTCHCNICREVAPISREQ